MEAKDTRQLIDRKARIDDRLDGRRQWESDRPVVQNTNLHYEVAGRATATSHGGIGLVHEFVREIGLVGAIDGRNPGKEPTWRAGRAALKCRHSLR